MRIIDLSHPLEDDRSWAPWWARTRVKYQGHRFGRFVVRLLFGLKSRHLRTGLGWANDNLKLSTHGTTHVDAPWHYAPTCEGKPARTIDEVPLDWFYGPGVVCDVTHLDANAAVSIEDMESCLDKSGHQLRADDIVLVRTGNDRLWGNREYFHTGPGMSAAATRWLIEKGVRLMGIDSWGWDRPLSRMALEARETGRHDLFWEAHYVGVDREYCHIERLTNLGELPATGFTVCAFPLKVKRGSAGPARVVALIDDEL